MRDIFQSFEAECIMKVLFDSVFSRHPELFQLLQASVSLPSAGLALFQPGFIRSSLCGSNHSQGSENKVSIVQA